MEVLAHVKSTTSDNTYEIRRGSDDVVYCTCWGWRRHRKCKHLTAYVTSKLNVDTTVSLAVEIDKVVELLKRTK